jgi:hypothetical protein
VVQKRIAEKRWSGFQDVKGARMALVSIARRKLNEVTDRAASASSAAASKAVPLPVNDERDGFAYSLYAQKVIWKTIRAQTNRESSAKGWPILNSHAACVQAVQRYATRHALPLIPRNRGRPKSAKRGLRPHGRLAEAKM